MGPRTRRESFSPELRLTVCRIETKVLLTHIRGSLNLDKLSALARPPSVVLSIGRYLLRLPAQNKDQVDDLGRGSAVVIRSRPDVGVSDSKRDSQGDGK